MLSVMITLMNVMESYVLQRKSEKGILGTAAWHIGELLKNRRVGKGIWSGFRTAPLEPKLFEIRAKGQEGIARSVFCTVKGKEIVILMTVIKKTNKIPKRQMMIARKRMKEVQDD